MVSTFERQISLGGIFSIYAFICYKFVSTKTKFNKKFHDAMILQGEKFQKEVDSHNFKIVQTPNEKILFLVGIENSVYAFRSENMMIIEKLIENFTPNAIVYEKDLKFSKEGISNLRDEIDPVIKKFEQSNNDSSQINSINKTIKINPDDNNANTYSYSIVNTISRLNQEDRFKLLSELEKVNKNISFDLFNLYTDNKRRTLTSNNCSVYPAGPEFMRVKSMIRKKMNALDNGNLNHDISEETTISTIPNINNSRDPNKFDKYFGLKDISKMSIKERVSYKQHQLDVNSKFDLYDDIKEYIETEITSEIELKNLKQENTRSKDLEGVKAQVDRIYNGVVISDMNDIIINNILDNKKIYIGVVIVRQERLNNLYEKLVDYYKNL